MNYILPYRRSFTAPNDGKHQKILSDYLAGHDASSALMFVMESTSAAIE